MKCLDRLIYLTQGLESHTEIVMCLPIVRPKVYRFTKFLDGLTMALLAREADPPLIVAASLILA